MKVYLDTSLLVADAIPEHAEHSVTRHFFDQIEKSSWTPVIVNHGLSEFYSVLTRTPWRQRLSPALAWQIVEANVIGKFEILAFSVEEHLQVLRTCAQEGQIGGLVYDALHMAAARKAGCDRIYTHNVRHFRKVAPDLYDRILMP